VLTGVCQSRRVTAAIAKAGNGFRDKKRSVERQVSDQPGDVNFSVESLLCIPREFIGSKVNGASFFCHAWAGRATR
jgi:hypothetical protein